MFGRKSILVLVVGALLAGCGQQGGREGEVIATVGSRKIYKEDILRRLSEMPSQIRSEFEGNDGRNRLMQGLIDEELLYLAAVDAGLEKNPEVMRQLDAERRRVLIRAYYTREVTPYTTMTEEDIRRFYDENLEELYKKPNESVVRWVVAKDIDTANEAREKLLSGMKWERVITEYGSHEPTRRVAGRIGAIGENTTLIPLVGAAPELTRTIDTLTIGTLSPVVRSPIGFHVLTVTERIPEAYIPYEKLKDDIRRTFSSDFVEEVRTEKVDALKEKYPVKILTEDLAESNEALDEGQVSRAEEAKKLFEMAQITSDPRKRIQYYREIVEKFPNDEHACEAQFMIGFVYSEELNDFDKAREALAKVKERADCKEEMVTSAQWLLDNMGKEPPPFEDPDAGR